ncbi:TonB-dependent receptor [Phaeocystidibacter luteus]|uniref:TonB-dependent receptor n=1 Tax=Phaeocystidibacter luteus TaxID=911197 RepID=A0A6N6RIB6_9FLAO|nr:TonB-dependent receptor plug domain-containing protein [Phaeocystidibacter luteus]KAB2814075.1 TonB-dependent receptor [Phaeocystidibacter luteus]
MKQFSMLGIFLLLSVGALAQRTVSGKVLNQSNGEPVDYAVVFTQSERVSTLPDGSFTIEAQSGEEVKVRAIGFETFEIGAEVSGFITVNLVPNEQVLTSVEVSAIRATDDDPVARTDYSEEEIEQNDVARDMPYILENTPSVVTTSDAGAGIGYTGLRIRGSDQTRINVTINGVPVNDQESQGVFWVNTPDLASSLSSMQIQRGVGTSTNGAGAFGASINMQTKSFTKDAYADVHIGGGSFNTQRYTLNFGTGLIDGHWTLDGRASRITSDGWIDRASSDLRSYYLALGYQAENTTIQAVVFGGRERTYQAWYGTDSATYEADPTFNPAGLYTDENGNVKFYDDQVDNYGQDYYQLHINHNLESGWKLGLSGFYTRGAGYYEEFREDENHVDYGLTPVVIDTTTIATTDLARRLWLDNHFYGVVANATGNIGNVNVIVGGGWNQYDGDHYGNVIWARWINDADPNHEFYFNNSVKTNINAYVKADYAISDALSIYADMQVRTVNYSGGGTEEENVVFDFEDDLQFFNPKAGLVYRMANSRLYASYALANREPNRVDYFNSAITGEAMPEAERLQDVEVGYEGRSTNFSWSVNGYFMYYTNQLALTGELNSVGAPIRENVGESYRAGIEISSTWKPIPQFTISENITFSDNRNLDYVEEVIGQGLVSRGNTPISYSPSIIANLTATAHLPKNLDLSITPRYVGKQYLSNTGLEGLVLPEYFVTDLRLSGQWALEDVKRIRAYVSALNVFSASYAPNGYSYSYAFGGQQYYGMGFYPQAPINYMLGVEFSF